MPQTTNGGYDAHQTVPGPSCDGHTSGSLDGQSAADNTDADNPFPKRPLWHGPAGLSVESPIHGASSRVTSGSRNVPSGPSPDALLRGEAFWSCLPLIGEVTAHVCRRHRLSADESEDFMSEVRLHFIEREFEPLRRFEGRSSLRTYLTVVITRLFLNYRNRLVRPPARLKL